MRAFISYFVIPSRKLLSVTAWLSDLRSRSDLLVYVPRTRDPLRRAFITLTTHINSIVRHDFSGHFRRTKKILIKQKDTLF